MGLDRLGFNTTLTKLDLNYNEIGDDAAASIAAVVKKNKIGCKVLQLQCVERDLNTFSIGKVEMDRKGNGSTLRRACG